MSHPRLSTRSSSVESAEIDAVMWVASPQESVIHARGPGGGLVCGHEVRDEPEMSSGYLPASRWPGYQPHLACLAAVPAWVGDLVEPRAARPYGEDDAVSGRHAVETMTTLMMRNLARGIEVLDGKRSRPDNEGAPGSSYLPGTRRKCNGTPTADSATPHDLGEVA